MSSKPHIQVAQREWSALKRSSVDSEETIQSLELLYQLTSSSRGPRGSLKMLQNSSGGHITVTSSSKRIFNCLSLSKPINKIIATAVQGHLDGYGDCGLLVVNLTLLLILKSVDSGLSLRVLSEVYECFLNICVNFLNSEKCPCKVKVPLSSLEFMKVCLRSILETKFLTGLRDKSLDHVQKIILESFLWSLPDFETNVKIQQEMVSVIAIEGFSVNDSRCERGLLIPCPDLSSFKETKLKFRTINSDDCEKKRVAVIVTSLAGDLEESLKVKHEVDEGVDVDSLSLDILSEFCKRLVSDSVGLVFCQKVIHPRLKRDLRHHGCFVLDRLGRQPIPFLLEVTGCTPIQSVSPGSSLSTYYGSLDDVHHRVLYRKSYLHLLRSDSHVATMFLCHLQEEALQELKEVCSTCLLSLRHLLYQPYTLSGAGSWQRGLADHLLQQVTDTSDELVKALEIPESFLLSAVRIFTAALRETTTDDFSHNRGIIEESESRHLYSDDPRRTQYGEELGGKTPRESAVPNPHLHVSLAQQPHLNVGESSIGRSNDLVLDNFIASMNALKTATLTATTVLRIGQTISEQ